MNVEIICLSLVSQCRAGLEQDSHHENHHPAAGCRRDHPAM